MPFSLSIGPQFKMPIFHDFIEKIPFRQFFHFLLFQQVQNIPWDFSTPYLSLSLSLSLTQSLTLSERRTCSRQQKIK